MPDYTGKISEYHKVIVYRENEIVGSEIFGEEPYNSQILKAIIKHKGDSAQMLEFFKAETQEGR